VVENLKNPFTDNYFGLKEQVLSNHFPWLFYDETIKDTPNKSKDSWFFSHTIISRPLDYSLIPTVSSTYFDLTHQVLKEIFEVNEIDVRCIYRANFNLVHPQTVKKTPMHVDHYDLPHKVLLVYLTSFVGGRTIVEIEGKEHFTEPKEDRIVTFDGSYLHAAETPEDGTRVVLNCTYHG